MSSKQLTELTVKAEPNVREYYVWSHTQYSNSGHGRIILAETPTKAAFKATDGIEHTNETIRMSIYVYDSKSAKDDDPNTTLNLMIMDLAAVEPACTECDEHEYIAFFRDLQTNVAGYDMVKEKCEYCGLVHKVVGEHMQDGTDGIESYYFKDDE